jgi:hypothetical protein
LVEGHQTNKNLTLRKAEILGGIVKRGRDKDSSCTPGMKRKSSRESKASLVSVSLFPSTCPQKLGTEEVESEEKISQPVPPSFSSACGVSVQVSTRMRKVTLNWTSGGHFDKLGWSIDPLKL